MTKLNRYIPLFEYYNYTESIKKKMVVSNGKKQIKYYSDNPNKKLITVDGKRTEVVMSPKEKMNRSKAAKKAARKPRNQAAINKKRKLSMMKR